jgi:TfoX/Sxy family transcriptional regulator of competence genes
MQMPKPTETDKARFRELVPEDPRIEVKPMFGNLGAFVNGNMFMGLFGADIGLKLASADADELRGLEGAGPFGPAERPMGGYVTIPSRMIGTDEGRSWVARAVDHVAALPPKTPGKGPKASMEATMSQSVKK